MLKDKIEQQYGSINKFIDTKLKEHEGKLPYSREHIYKIINHSVENPGIKTLYEVSKLVDIPLGELISEWTNE